MIAERLRFLYGRDPGDRAAADLGRLLERYRRRLPPPDPVAERFDQRDAILITYGDSFDQAGLPPLRALCDFAERHLSNRLSTVHVLPFFPYSSDYGFSVIDHEGVDPRLGSWKDVAELGSRFKLMFDLVLNHVSVQHEWFQRFLRCEPPYDRFFITVDPATDLSTVTRPRTSPLLTPFDTVKGRRWVWTTFSADQVDLDYRNPEVLLRMVEVILTYVERGAGLLRLDAVGYLWKEVGTPSVHLAQTHEVVKLFRDVLDLVAPQVAIVTETNVPHRDNVGYFGDGRDEAQVVYQFPLAPLVLDAFARADAGRLAAWAGQLSTPSPATTFLNFLASHDGIGVVPAMGLLSTEEVADLVRGVIARGGEVSYKREPDGRESPYELNATLFDALSGPAEGPEPWRTRLDRFVCAHAICLALAGVPGVYVHSLFGTPNDREGYARSGWKRDLNHRRVDLPALERALDDASSEPAQVFDRMAGLLEARRSTPAFHPASSQRVHSPSPAVLAVVRGRYGGETLLALQNVSPMPQPVGAHLVEEALGGAEAQDLLTGRRFDFAVSPAELEAYEVLWLRTPTRRSSAMG
jgi:glucosylglycerate phosphorylase